jgi:hypothetical protein
VFISFLLSPLLQKALPYLIAVALVGGGLLILGHKNREIGRLEVIEQSLKDENRRLQNATQAETNLRRDLDAHPDRLHDDDGFRRAD